jgi:hypothetical protein
MTFTFTIAIKSSAYFTLAIEPFARECYAKLVTAVAPTEIPPHNF